MRFAIIDDDGNIVCTSRGKQLTLTEEEIVTRLVEQTTKAMGLSKRKAAKLDTALVAAFDWVRRALKADTRYIV